MMSAPRSSIWLILLLVVVFAGAAALRVWAVANTDPLDIGAAPLVDDSFYYFSLGRNLADSLAARVDSFHLTNGFQPLWGFLAAIPYLLLSDAAAIPALQLMGAAFSLGAGAVIYAFTVEVTRSRLAGTLNAALWLFMPYAARESINGMETSLAAFGLLLAAWLFYRVCVQATQRRVIAAGLAGGLAIMCRVDLALFVAAAALFLLVFPPAAYRTPADRLRLAFTFGVTALIPCIPWVIFSLALGKSPLPESGAAVRELAFHYMRVSFLPSSSVTAEQLQAAAFRNAVDVLLRSIRNAIVWIAPIRRGLFAEFYLYWIALGVVALIAFVRRRPAWQVLTVALLMLGMMFAAYLFLVPVYWYYERYLHPAAALLSAVLGIVLAGWVIDLARLSANARRVGIAAALIYGAVLLYFSVYIPYRSANLAIVAHVSRLEYDVTAWINEHLTGDDVRIGSYQSGLIGYYLVPPHLNLDGVVNGAAHEALASRSGWRYVCDQQITHLVERPDVMASILNADASITPEAAADAVGQLRQFGEIVFRLQIPPETAFNSDYVVLQVDRAQCESGE
jgi:4-amino-4-deoxy-L-arabinose transferase-like glycosyltransferase